MPTPALNAVNLSWLGQDTSAGTPALGTVNLTWLVGIITPNVVLEIEGLVSSSFGRPRLRDDSVPEIELRPAGFTTTTVGAHEALAEAVPGTTLLRPQRVLTASSNVGAPTLLSEASNARLRPEGFSSHAVGTPALGVALQGIGFLSSAVPALALRGEFAATGFLGSAVGSPGTVLAHVRPWPTASGGGFGVPTIKRDAHC